MVNVVTVEVDSAGSTGGTLPLFHFPAISGAERLGGLYEILLFGRVPLTHPHQRLRGQHTVVHGSQIHRGFVRYTGHTLYGPESNRTMLPSHHQNRPFPAAGLCSPLVHVNYLLVLFQ